MLLKINDQFRITSRPLNIELQRSVTAKKNSKSKKVGEKTWQTFAYYPCLEQALARLLDESIIDSQSEGVLLFQEIRQTKADIINALKEANLNDRRRKNPLQKSI
jgi:ERCC4-related helicase